MKAILALLVLSASLSTFAMEETYSLQYTTMASSLPFLATVYSSGGFDEKIIAAEVQEYNQSGNLSLELQELVKRVQSEDQTLSLEEALDLIQSSLAK